MSFSLSYLGYVSCWFSLVPFLAVPSACCVPCAGWLRGFGRCVCSFSQGYDACAKIRKNPITPAFFLVYLSLVCFLPAFSPVFPSFSFFSRGLLLALAVYFLNGYSQSITHTPPGQQVHSLLLVLAVMSCRRGLLFSQQSVGELFQLLVVAFVHA